MSHNTTISRKGIFVIGHTPSKKLYMYYRCRFIVVSGYYSEISACSLGSVFRISCEEYNSSEKGNLHSALSGRLQFSAAVAYIGAAMQLEFPPPPRNRGRQCARPTFLKGLRRKLSASSPRRLPSLHRTVRD